MQRLALQSVLSDVAPHFRSCSPPLISSSMKAHSQRLLLFLLSVSFLASGCGPKEESLAEQASKSEAKAEPGEQRQINFLALAERKFGIGDLEPAADAAYKALVKEPNSEAAKLIASEIEAARGNHQAAIDLASSIEPGSPRGRKAIQIHFQQLLKLERPSQAADVIAQAIESLPGSDPIALEWHHKAWSLLCRVGRRQEASAHADVLCRSGDAGQFVMASLARRNQSFPIELEIGGKPEENFTPGLGMARWYFTQQENALAIQELSAQLESEFESPAACALYGRLLAETQAFEDIPIWHTSCDPAVKDMSDYWIALGTFFFDQHQYQASARAFLEAVQRDPTSNACTKRLAKVFDSLDEYDLSEQFRHRDSLNYQAEFIAKESFSGGLLDDPNSASAVLIELGRPFEAIGWKLVTLQKTDVAMRRTLSQKITQLKQNPDAVGMANKMALVGIDPSGYSLQPAMENLLRHVPKDLKAKLQTKQLAVPSLVNVATDVGLNFQWYQDVQNRLDLIPLHELMGGGLAIIDFDLDGWPDVYLAQGAGEPPTNACTRSNVLSRNIATQFQAVTEDAGAADFNYSSGLSAGDVNQDGFTDLFLGSLGRNRLLINNGDGTFTDTTDMWGSIQDRFTSSLAIADLNGDQLPDLFEANYVEMKGGFEMPEIAEDGAPMQPAPINHFAQSDRWLENLGDGTFQLHEIPREVADPGTSLGVVVTDFDNNGSNEIFVGNDARTNHFLVHKGNNTFVNTAGAKGISAGFSGMADACMGIATGDFDRDGAIDLHISNYAKESANHYIQSSGGAFKDLAPRYGIDQFTLPYIGFGAKAVDVDRNGWLDVIVTNGHVFDLRGDGDDFRMPPQLLSNLGDRFELAQVEDASGYWDSRFLGRTIAMTDFDRDGAIDFVIGHLHQPVALLHNQTGSPGHWIQFELIGTATERDAIGARITLTMESGQQFSQWVTAGDGYLSSDEPVIEFGLGDQAILQRVEVAWPGSKTQVVSGLNTNKRYLVVEGTPGAYER